MEPDARQMHHGQYHHASADAEVGEDLDLDEEVEPDGRTTAAATAVGPLDT